MMRRRLVLASASTARRRLLSEAGIATEVMVSGVDEEALEATDTASLVQVLATAKAEAVLSAAGDALVLGCDSLLEFEGTGWGKPRTAQQALERWQRMRGRQATLVTGHCLLDGSGGGRAQGVCATSVRFGTPDDAELEAYVASGEPLAVAGGFTLDGRSAPFIEGIVGDPGNVIGLSLPLLRQLLGQLGVRVTDLW